MQNTLVQMLERDTGIRSMTIARFLAQWGRLLHEPGNATLLREARSALGDHVLVLDEASMVSNEDKAKLVRLANLAEVQRLVLVGDKRQLAAVDAGKPFDLVQQAGIERANMDVNLRGRDPILRRAQAAAQEGRIDDALQALAPSTIEARGDSAIVAAEKWLSLSPADRDRTSIYASGRALRSAVNEAVQCGLKANGELGPRSGRLAASRAQTKRRTSGKDRQEGAVKDSLLKLGFEEVEPRKITTIALAPEPGQFCGESVLGNRKGDIIVRLWDHRVMPIECKVSNSSTNSVKRLPNRSSLRQYFKTAIEPEIRQQHRSGQCPIRVDIVDEETEISVSIDPAKSPYSSGGYASYDRPSIKNRNPYYKALRSKVPQLKGVDALTGIIICDADCATMADGGFGNRIDLMDTLTRDFLRQNSSVDFVLAISVREERRGWHPAEGYDRQMFAMLRTQDALKIAGDLDTTFRSMMRNFPYPRDMPVNAARRAIEADYGWGHHGGCKMSGDNVRLSSRMIMEVLTGQISVDRMSELQRGNPFKLPFANGRLPTKIEVIPGGEDDNDDWIEFTFGGSDPAITPFK